MRIDAIIISVTSCEQQPLILHSQIPLISLSFEGDGYEQTLQAVIDSTPLQKAADPADIADAVLGIIEGSDMLTGQILLVDGGQNI